MSRRVVVTGLGLICGVGNTAEEMWASDHADFPSLVRYAKATGAGRVFTVHGHEDSLAAALRKEGIRAEPLRETMQLELIWRGEDRGVEGADWLLLLTVFPS